jgi:hypothetical protein
MKTTQSRNTFLNSLSKWQMKQDKQVKLKRRFDLLSLIIFVGALLLCIWAIDIYHETFIDWKILVTPFITGGILGILIFRRKLLKYNYPFWSTLLIGFGTGSFILYFCFLFINANFADISQKTEVFTIEKIGTFASGPCGEPYVIINFYGLSKQVVFNCEDNERVKTASNLKVSFSKGLFGYDIIRAKSLD